jgi:hypothetical protein
VITGGAREIDATKLRDLATESLMKLILLAGSLGTLCLAIAACTRVRDLSLDQLGAFDVAHRARSTVGLGDRLITSGTVGLEAVEHRHFEVRRNGRPVELPAIDGWNRPATHLTAVLTFDGHEEPVLAVALASDRAHWFAITLGDESPVVQPLHVSNGLRAIPVDPTLGDDAEPSGDAFWRRTLRSPRILLDDVTLFDVRIGRVATLPKPDVQEGWLLDRVVALSADGRTITRLATNGERTWEVYTSLPPGRAP